MRLSHHLPALLGAFLITGLLAVRTAHATTPVFADPALTCAGLTPCFATIQEAVNNAGPPPADVGVFPGTYAESVDLGLMGSAIGGMPGDISIQALDAAGQPAVSGVTINPSAPGGPGAGTAINSGLMGFFIGDITLRGLAGTSPDTSAIGLFMEGDLVLEDFLVQGAGSLGVLAVVMGNATVARGVAQLNVDGGMQVGASGNVTATDITALNNGTDGIALLAGEQVTASGIEASMNEDGLTALSCLQIDMQNVLAEMNTNDGVIMQLGGNQCDGMTMNLLDPLQGGLSLDMLPQGELPARGAQGNLSINLQQITATGNGNIGIGALAVDGTVMMSQLTATDNASTGIITQTPMLILENSQSTGGERGVVVTALDALLNNVTANDTLPGTNPPFDGNGFVITAADAVLSNVQGNNNAFSGLLMAVLNAPTIMPDYSINNAVFNGNSQGVALLSDNLADVSMNNVSAINNQVSGMTLPDLNLSSMNDVTVSGSPLGMAVNVSSRLTVETAEVTANDTGLLMVVNPGASVRVSCSNISDNVSFGLQLAQGNAVDARGNFWGNGSGPTHPGNPGGTGDAVGDAATGDSGNVNYDDFLTQAATVDDCPVVVLPPVRAVPALNRVGLMLLIVLMGVLCLVAVRRRMIILKNM